MGSMVGRGSYAKGTAKREEILRTALELFARNGYRGTSIRELAAAANLSQAGLLHYFDSKEELLTEVLRKRDDLNGEFFAQADDAVDAMLAVIKHNAEVPGLVQLFTTLSAAATEADHAANGFFAERYSHLRIVLARQIRARQAAGAMDAALDPEKVAAILLATVDGLQLQWLFDPTQDMAANVEYLWSLFTASGSRGTR